MDKSFLIIKNAIEHYDENYERFKIGKIYNMIKYIQFKIINNKNVISFYDSKKKIIIEHSFECCCTYITKKNILKWAWSSIELDKYNDISKQLLTYVINVKSDDLIIKNELINSSVGIVDKLQIQSLISLITEFTRMPVIFKFNSNIINEFENLDKFINYDYKNINDDDYDYNFYLFLFPLK